MDKAGCLSAAADWRREASATFKVDICNDHIRLRTIEKSQLDRVLCWYNTGGEYRYATGMDGHVSMDFLQKRFEDIQRGKYDFFLGIHQGSSSDEGERYTLIGALIGGIVDQALWIKLLTVDSNFRRRGIGSMATALLLDFIKNNGYARDAYLSVVEKNTDGMRFWAKNGFYITKKADKTVYYDNENSKVIIMQRKLV